MTLSDQQKRLSKWIDTMKSDDLIGDAQYNSDLATRAVRVSSVPEAKAHK